jgi:2-polyprenyl-3-methyl-5-hydroxy-6-metoxy-1,4-benzoquinol methylase
MAADYDLIAKQYRESKKLPFRRYVEWYTYRRMMGDIAGKSVLDLACGEGFYSRRIKVNGAAQVIGVDLSENMIKLARKREAQDRLGITYTVNDVLELGKIGNFDLVVASYLLNYARTRAHLLDMCRTIFANLKPGGRFVSINNNSEQSPETFPLCAKYGFTKTLAGPLNEGAAITYHFFRRGQEFHINNYYLSRKAHEWAFHKVGFREVYWKKIEVSSEGIQNCEKHYWQDFLDCEPIVGIVCNKELNVS